jgi:phage tail-like protein
MPPFAVNTHRFDPYKSFKFRVKWDGRVVAGVSKVSALKRTTEVIKHREGNSPGTQNKMPGASAFESITLERGVTHDLEFERWASLIYDVRGAGAVSLKFFRKDVEIQLLNEAGQLAKAYHVRKCWVSEYQALPELDGNANAVAIEMMKLETEGWERDVDIPEPTET